MLSLTAICGAVGNSGKVARTENGRQILDWSTREKKTTPLELNQPGLPTPPEKALFLAPLSGISIFRSGIFQPALPAPLFNGPRPTPVQRVPLPKIHVVPLHFLQQDFSQSRATTNLNSHCEAVTKRQANAHTHDTHVTQQESEKGPPLLLSPFKKVGGNTS